MFDDFFPPIALPISPVPVVFNGDKFVNLLLFLQSPISIGSKHINEEVVRQNTLYLTAYVFILR